MKPQWKQMSSLWVRVYPASPQHLRRHKRGARVAVFEKQPSIGGTSNFFEGIFAVGSAMQKEKYIAYSPDQAFKNFMEYNHWRVDARLVRSLINRSADNIDWLKNLGVEFLEVTINMPDAPRTYHVVKGRGHAVVKALALRAQRRREWPSELPLR